MTQPAVHRSGHRYEIRVDGELVGVTEYRDRSNQRIFVHTEIAKPFQGKGMSPVLIAGALDDTRTAGMRIVPMCLAVAAYLDKHGDFADITDPVTPEVLNWHEAGLA